MSADSVPDKVDHPEPNEPTALSHHFWGLDMLQCMMLLFVFV